MQHEQDLNKAQPWKETEYWMVNQYNCEQFDKSFPNKIKLCAERYFWENLLEKLQWLVIHQMGHRG